MYKFLKATKLFLIFGLAVCLSSAPGVAQNFGRTPTAVGTKIADGSAYVTVVVLKHQPNPKDNGRMLMSFEGGSGEGLPIYESTDNGATWQFVLNVQDPTAGSNCNLQWQPHLTEMPRTQHGIEAGTVILSGSTLCRQEGSERSGWDMSLRLFTSEDFGRTWDYVSTYAESEGGNPVWEPFLLILDDGTFVEFYSDETYKAEGYNQVLGHKVSKDGGKTWGDFVLDTGFPGGVERPGMVIIDRLPDGRYVSNYEIVAGDPEGQVWLKFSDDGLDWGDPAHRGTPVEAMNGLFPDGTPNVFWFPLGGPDGVIVVTAGHIEGPMSDHAGNSIFWNKNLGEGPWWPAPTPVQKIDKSRAGWTQSMILLEDGRLLHITSSGTTDGGNEILYNAEKVNFDRYEAEAAAQQGTDLMNDRSMSHGAKARLGAKDVGKLTFEINAPSTGSYKLTVEYKDNGFPATPRLTVNSYAIAGSAAPVEVDPELAEQAESGLGSNSSGQHQLLSAVVDLREGENIIEVLGGEYALDIDYLEVTPLDTQFGDTDAASDSGANSNTPSTLPPIDDYSDFGPFEFTIENGTGPDGTYTIVRPKTLGVLGENRFLHAPLIFGPGIGGAPSSMMPLLERIASHGFVIISKTLNGGPGNPENNRRMIAGLDWLIAQNTTAGSMFEGKLAVDYAVSMGHSVGGTAAVDIGGHDAIVTVVSIQGHGAKPIEESSATFLLLGGEKDVMRDGQSWLAPTYEALEAPTFFSLVEGADHGYIGRTLDGVYGGVETPAMIAWIRYWAYNDKEAAKYFYGDDCIMCKSPWTNAKRKNWE